MGNFELYIGFAKFPIKSSVKSSKDLWTFFKFVEITSNSRANLFLDWYIFYLKYIDKNFLELALDQWIGLFSSTTNHRSSTEFDGICISVFYVVQLKSASCKFSEIFKKSLKSDLALNCGINLVRKQLKFTWSLLRRRLVVPPS